MVDYIAAHGVAGRRVLEVGGGIGAMHVELLKAGAANAVNVDISPEYEDAARELLREAGLEDRVEREVGDFAENPERFDVADDVVMNRVICCYPHMEKLMNAALSRSNRFVGTSFPRDRRSMRGWFGLQNWWHRVRRIDFQAYVHSPAEIVATAQRRGFSVAFEDSGLMWRTVVFAKTA